jgi:hypothetical protein
MLSDKLSRWSFLSLIEKYIVYLFGDFVINVILTFHSILNLLHISVTESNNAIRCSKKV